MEKINKKIKIHSKTFAILTGIALGLLPFLALAISVSPTTIVAGDLITITCSSESNFVNAYDEEDVYGTTFDCLPESLTNINYSNEVPNSTNNHTYHIVELTVASINEPINYPEVLSYEEVVGETSFTLGEENQISNIFPAFTTQIGEELDIGLKYIFALLAGMIGLGILIIYVRKWIGWHNPSNSKIFSQEEQDFFKKKNRKWIK